MLVNPGRSVLESNKGDVMKKFLLLGAFLLTVFTVQKGYSQGCCDTSCCEEQACNECYCLYVRYEPCYYNTKRCIEEQIPCCKRCCRYVPKYYQVQRCRYVPEYYTETCCKQECEYYDVQEYKTCKKTICEPQCKYVPKYYWKHTCGNQTGCCN